MSLAIADRGYVLENGRVALSGEAAELMHSADIAARYLGADVAGEPSRLDDGRRRRLVDAIRSAAVTWPD
jgi:branched-chain amino acid transport system ATP-binding protein